MLLMEIRGGQLYHWLSTNKVDDLVEHDKILGKWRHYLPVEKKYVLGNSLTRNEKLEIGAAAKLTFDQTKLAARFKIYPLNGDYVFHHTRQKELGNKSPKLDHIHDRKNQQSFAEEFVQGDILRAHLYITEVWVEDLFEEEKFAPWCEEFKIKLTRK